MFEHRATETRQRNAMVLMNILGKRVRVVVLPGKIRKWHVLYVLLYAERCNTRASNVTVISQRQLYISRNRTAVGEVSLLAFINSRFIRSKADCCGGQLSHNGSVLFIC